MNARALLDPTILARIRDLNLLSRTIAEGRFYGLHHSQQKGAGMEFSQYRQYEQGDDLRQIDWKLFARSDRIYVRQAERESQLNIWFVLDTSASMAEPSLEIESWSRIQAARVLTAAMAHMAINQGDAIGLFGFNDTDPTVIPCHRGRRQLDQVLHRLQQLEPAGRWPGEQQLDLFWQQLSAPGIVVFVSDFLEQDSEIRSLVRKVSRTGKDVLALQLLCRHELDFPWSGSVEFHDRESGDVVRVNAGDARSRYREQMRRTLEGTREEMNRLGVTHQRALIESPLDEVLWQFLRLRDQASGDAQGVATRRTGSSRR